MPKSKKEETPKEATHRNKTIRLRNETLDDIEILGKLDKRKTNGMIEYVLSEYNDANRDALTEYKNKNNK